MSETLIQKRTMGVLNHRDSPCRVWRNNVGGYYDANGRYVEYGLSKGSADLIGVERILVTQEMVGQVMARFLSVEMKTPVGKESPEQKAWGRVIEQLGGTHRVFRSPEDAREHIQQLRNNP